MGTFVTSSKTKSYRPGVLSWSTRRLDHRGYLLPGDIEAMRLDSQVRFGLRILYSPLPSAKWKVEGEEPVASFVDKTIGNIWRNHLPSLFLHVVYGTCGFEVLYEEDEDGLVQFLKLKDFHPRDVRALEQGGELCGISVRGTEGDNGRGWIFSPRSLWIANEAEFGLLIGRTRLEQAWYPWQEKTARHGAIDIRRLWYLKNAYRGGRMRHPGGTIEIEPGVFRSCRDYAREIAELFETGGILTLPNDYNPETGKYEWDWEDPMAFGEPPGISNYVDQLDQEILVAIGIPPEVAHAADNGSGWAGRSVPFLVYLGGEDQIFQQILFALDQQIVRPAVIRNFSAAAARSYQLVPISLIPANVQDEATQGTGSLVAEDPTGSAMGQLDGMSGGELGGSLGGSLGEETNPWESFRGPSGGRGWRNRMTGEVRYQQNQPVQLAEKKSDSEYLREIQPVHAQHMRELEDHHEELGKLGRDLSEARKEHKDDVRQEMRVRDHIHNRLRAMEERMQTREEALEKHPEIGAIRERHSAMRETAQRIRDAIKEHRRQDNPHADLLEGVSHLPVADRERANVEQQVEAANYPLLAAYSNALKNRSDHIDRVHTNYQNGQDKNVAESPSDEDERVLRVLDSSIGSLEEKLLRRGVPEKVINRHKSLHANPKRDDVLASLEKATTRPYPSMTADSNRPDARQRPDDSDATDTPSEIQPNSTVDLETDEDISQHLPEAFRDSGIEGPITFNSIAQHIKELPIAKIQELHNALKEGANEDIIKEIHEKALPKISEQSELWPSKPLHEILGKKMRGKAKQVVPSPKSVEEIDEVIKNHYDPLVQSGDLKTRQAFARHFGLDHSIEDPHPTYLRSFMIEKLQESQGAGMKWRIGSHEDVAKVTAALAQPETPAHLAEMQQEINDLDEQYDPLKKAIFETEQEYIKANKETSEPIINKLDTLRNAAKLLVFKKSELVRKKREAETQHRADVVVGALKPLLQEKPAQVTHSLGNVSPEAEKLIHQVAKALQSCVAWTSTEKLPELAWDEGVSRAGFYPDTNTIKISAFDGEDTAYHEMAHYFEQADPEIGFACQQFLAYRCGSEEAIPMDRFNKSYRPEERGRKDRFEALWDNLESAYYTGKDYYQNGENATEIFAIGVQLLFTKTDLFAKRDPEYCAFIVGVLTGRIRGRLPSAIPAKEGEQ